MVISHSYVNVTRGYDWGTDQKIEESAWATWVLTTTAGKRMELAWTVPGSGSLSNGSSQDEEDCLNLTTKMLVVPIFHEVNIWKYMTMLT